MVKKSTITNVNLDSPYTKTELEEQPAQQTADNADLNEGRIVSQGVGLRQGEIAALQAIADRLGGKEEGVTLNALMRIAIRHFITEVRAGRVDAGAFFETPPKPKKRARLS